MDKPHCDIIIPVWNQPEHTERCLESLISHTRSTFRAIVIDNGSEQETRDILKKFSDSDSRIEVITNPTNTGFVRAINQGIEASQAPLLCLLNNDTELTEGWLEELIEVLDMDSSIGMVNPLCNEPEREFGLIPTDGARYYLMDKPQGFCLLIRGEVIDAVGGLNTDYGMGLYDDFDFGLRVQQKGFEIALATKAFVYHHRRASFKVKKDTEILLKKNKALFEKIWGTSVRIMFVSDEAWSAEPDKQLPTYENLLAIARNNVTVHMYLNGTSKGAFKDILFNRLKMPFYKNMNIKQTFGHEKGALLRVHLIGRLFRLKFFSNRGYSGLATDLPELADNLSRLAWLHRLPVFLINNEIKLVRVGSEEQLSPKEVKLSVCKGAGRL